MKIWSKDKVCEKLKRKEKRIPYRISLLLEKSIINNGKSTWKQITIIKLKKKNRGEKCILEKCFNAPRRRFNQRILRVSNLSQRTISFRDILEFRIEYRKSSITACASERTRPLSFHFFERHVPGVVNIQCIRSTIGYKSYPLLYFSPAIPQRQLNNFLKRSTPSDVGGRRNLWRVRQHPDRWCTARGSRSRILRRGSSSPHPPLHPSFIISRLEYSHPVYSSFPRCTMKYWPAIPINAPRSVARPLFLLEMDFYQANTIIQIFPPVHRTIINSNTKNAVYRLIDW